MAKQIFIIGMGAPIRKVSEWFIKNGMINDTITRPLRGNYGGLVISGPTWEDVKLNIDDKYADNGPGKVNLYRSKSNGNSIKYIEEIKADYPDAIIWLVYDKALQREACEQHLAVNGVGGHSIEYLDLMEAYITDNALAPNFLERGTISHISIQGDVRLSGKPSTPSNDTNNPYIMFFKAQ